MTVLSIFTPQELFTVLEEKFPVIVLKDVSIKHLLLIVEYVYLGNVKLELEDVEEFVKAAKNLQIKVEFEEPKKEFEESKKEIEDMSQDLLTEVGDEEMHSSYSDHTMDPTSFEEDEMEYSIASAHKSSKNSTGRKFEKDDEGHKKGPSPKKIKRSMSGIIVSKSLFKAPDPSDPQLNPCFFCDRKMRDKDRKYHQRFCWENPDRITSDCQHCSKKYQLPAKLRVHMTQVHPKIKF